MSWNNATMILFDSIQSWRMLWMTQVVILHDEVYLWPDSSSAEPWRISVVRNTARKLATLIVVLGVGVGVGVVCESEPDRFSIASLQRFDCPQMSDSSWAKTDSLAKKKEKFQTAAVKLSPKWQQHKLLIIPCFFLKSRSLFFKLKTSEYNPEREEGWWSAWSPNQKLFFLESRRVFFSQNFLFASKTSLPSGRLYSPSDRLDFCLFPSCAPPSPPELHTTPPSLVLVDLTNPTDQLYETRLSSHFTQIV